MPVAHHRDDAVTAISVPAGLRPPFGRPRLRYLLVLLAVATAGEGEVDPEVLAAAIAGDAEAFARLVGCYDRRLRALAYRLLGDRDRMDDALQDAYVKAYRGLGRFKRDSSVGTWLYRIVYNACLDELRRGRRVLPLVAMEPAERVALGPGPDDIAGWRSDLATALAALPPEQRAAVLLVDADGFDYAGAAAVLGVPAGTVASRLNRARVALRQALGEQ
jgi:RNA polymerase sigma-70 factor (ECF subfamily)